MGKKLWKPILFLLIVIHSLPCFTAVSFGASYENLTDLGLQSKSAVLMDTDTGTVIYEQNSHEKLPPASVTKVMTLLLIYEAIEDGKLSWDDIVTVSEHAASMGGSQVYLEPMEQQTVEDMTKCIAIASANDAAVAMAEAIGGSEQGFVDLMNQKAQELGMEDTHFVNACGLDADGHVTSAYDIALMSRELTYRFPEVFDLTTVWQDTITHKTRKGESEFGLTNTNKLIKWYNGATGLKTGSTGKALYCLAGTAQRDGLKLIGVVMAAPDYKTRFEEVMQLFDYGFANYAVKPLTQQEETVGEVMVYKGEKETIPAVIEGPVNALLPKGDTGEIETQLSLVPSLAAPVEKGAKVGEAIFFSNGKEVARCDVVAGENMEKATVRNMIEKLLRYWC